MCKPQVHTYNTHSHSTLQGPWNHPHLLDLNACSVVFVYVKQLWPSSSLAAVFPVLMGRSSPACVNCVPGKRWTNAPALHKNHTSTIEAPSSKTLRGTVRSRHPKISAWNPLIWVPPVTHLTPDHPKEKFSVWTPSCPPRIACVREGWGNRPISRIM